MQEEYKELLQAIFNSDQKEDDYKYDIIAVYDTLDNDKLIATFKNSNYCAMFFNTTPNTIASGICKKQLRGNRYRLERVNLKEDI